MMHVRYSRRCLIRFVCSIAAVVLCARGLTACTTFCMNDGAAVVFGANYDWDTGVGVVIVNKRAVAKVAMTGRPARWTSRFASITFNQYGRDFPTAEPGHRNAGP